MRGESIAGALLMRNPGAVVLGVAQLSAAVVAWSLLRFSVPLILKFNELDKPEMLELKIMCANVQKTFVF